MIINKIKLLLIVQLISFSLSYEQFIPIDKYKSKEIDKINTENLTFALDIRGMKKDETIYLTFISTNNIHHSLIKYYWSTEIYTKITNITKDFSENSCYGNGIGFKNNKDTYGIYCSVKKKDNSYNTLIIFFESKFYNDFEITHNRYSTLTLFIGFIILIFIFILVIIVGIYCCYKYDMLCFNRKPNYEKFLLDEQNNGMPNYKTLYDSSRTY